MNEWILAIVTATQAVLFALTFRRERKAVAYSGQTPRPNPASTTDHEPDPATARAVESGEKP